MKLIKLIIPLFLILFLCSACSAIQRESLNSSEADVDWQLPFEEVLAEINASHKSITKPVFDLEEFEAKYVRDKAPREFILEIPQGPEKDGYLSGEQMKRDAYVLMHYLRTTYSLYDYYGGDEKFDAVLTEIADAITRAGEMDPQEFSLLLLEHLSFIDDGHFSINGKKPSPFMITAFYREVAFGRIGGKYVNLETGKEVKRVNGFPEPDSLFRLSLSDDYKLVYYPVVQISVPFQECFEKSSNGIKTEPADKLIIVYNDGSSQELAGFKDYRGVFADSSVEAGICETQGIPVLRTTRFDNSTQKKLMMKFLEDYCLSPAMVVDLRINGGGYECDVLQWLSSYTGHETSGKSYTVYMGALKSLYENLSSYEKTVMENRLQVINDQYVNMNAVEDVFIDNPNRLLIVLMSKWTISSAESFIDHGHSVENVLFVGDASCGVLENNMCYSSVGLPYSHLSVTMGNSARVFSDDEYFREARGFLPDIWVPSTEAEDLICGFLQKMRKE